MKIEDYNDAINNTPKFMAVFRVTRVPPWAKPFVAVGDFVAYNPMYEHIITRRGHGLELGASYLKFFEYQTLDEWKSTATYF